MTSDLAIVWPVHWLAPLGKSCLSCHEEWGMHHRCPALGGRFNCC